LRKGSLLTGENYNNGLDDTDLLKTDSSMSEEEKLSPNNADKGQSIYIEKKLLKSDDSQFFSK
jgi:hypothetical protein